MGLIVLIIALALPAFSFISGSRSVDGAINVVSAYLGRARAEAIAAQRPTGVLFYVDPATQRVAMAVVQATPPRNTDSNANWVDYFFDLLPDREPALLPDGITLQLINDGNQGATRGDRYLGFNEKRYFALNTTPGPPPSGTLLPDNQPLPRQIGGMVVFDSAGRVITPRIALRCLADARDASGSFLTRATRMGALAWGVTFDDSVAAPAAPNTVRDLAYTQPTTTRAPVRGALGLALVDAELFRNAGGTLADPQLLATSFNGSPESAEESWLDENATPLLINRYTGTLVKGQ
jgi:hypothetical protein